MTSPTRAYVPFHKRFPSLPPVSTPVVDVEDALAWPEIAKAIDRARELRAQGGRDEAL